MSSAAARRGGGANGGGGGGWLHAAWLALTGGAAELLTAAEEVAGGCGGGGAARSGSRYELVSTEEPDGDETSWESDPGPASEAALFLVAREEDPKTTTTNSPESIFACDELRVSRTEFWRWPAKRSGAGAGEPAEVAVAESEPFLTRRRGAKRVNDAEMEDHPFSFGRHGRMESSSSAALLLLSSS